MNSEIRTSPQIGSKEKPTLQSEKRISAITRYIENRLLQKPGLKAGSEEEKEIAVSAASMSPDEKAIRIYENALACSQERGGKLNPYIISELKNFWHDESARRTFLKKYSEARVDAKEFRLAGLGKEWANVERDMENLSERRAVLKQELVLQKVKKPTDVIAAQSRLQNTKKALNRLEESRDQIMSLDGYEKTLENTDAVALIMYETLKRYHDQAKAGFVWVPSRRDLHKKILSEIEETGKSPLLLGPPGTGKTTQIDAVARELTGESSVRIPCSSTLGEDGLIAVRDHKAGEGAYDFVGCIAQAYTGYNHSQDKKPAHPTGRVAVLDEISQLNMERGMAPIKDVRQAKPGKPLSRHVRKEVLPGAFLAATSNVPIADERLEREFSRIPVDYFRMTAHDPELHEFMLAKLLRDGGNFPLVNESVLKPAYEIRSIPEEKRVTLIDGRRVIAADEIVEDQTDKRHGFLFRLAFAIRALQDAYIHGSKFNEKHLANTALYHDFDSNGKIIIKGYISDLKFGATTSPGGEMLKLTAGSSTLTVEIISKWIEGYKGGDFVRLMQKMLKNHMGQTSPDDAEKIKVIFDHFHLLDDEVQTAPAEPLTPKQIGYLSPRVPRPLYVEKPKPAEDSSAQELETEVTPKEIKVYETIQVLLEDGERVNIKVRGFRLSDGIYDLKAEALIPAEVAPGKNLRVNGIELTFAGIVEDKNSEHDGKFVGKVAGEALYWVFEEENFDFGIFDYELNGLDKEIKDDLPELLKTRWGIDCENNAKNNPYKVPCPV